MEQTVLYLNNEHSVGLGDNLCLLSGLVNSPANIDLYVNNNHNTYDRLVQYKRIFRIPDSKLKIILWNEEGNFNNTGWPVKLFVDYYKPQFINIGGKQIPTRTDKTNKKFIGLVRSIESPRLIETLKWPYCRARPQEYWDKIVNWLTSKGYDVITLDNPYNSLEDKIAIMAEHCKAIIGYEGGMAHLSHMLGIPYFMVDWLPGSPNTDLGEYHCEMVHKTNSVFILRNDEELFLWGQGDFEKHISDLKKGKTNNRIVTGEVNLKFAWGGVFGDLFIMDKYGRQVIKRASGLFSDTNTMGMFQNQFYGNGITNMRQNQ